MQITAQEVKAALGQNSIDCFLVDFHLGEVTSETLIEELRVSHPYLPIIVLSGQGDEQKAASVLRLGAADYLPKSLASEAELDRAISHATIKFKLEESLELERCELVKANKLLQQQSREIQSFYHTVSHELKTPITAIREFNSLLNDEILGEVNDGQRDALVTSLNCCDRLIRMVNDLFDAARIETGKLRLYKTHAQLSAVIDHEVKIMRPAAEHKSIGLRVLPYEVLPQIQADPQRLGQVLCNLIGNAIKYTQSGGHIDIRVEHSVEEGFLKVSVEDDGYGISEEHTEFVFHRMYQCQEEESTASSSESGMGIGLFLCHQIIQLHGGKLDFTSKAGEGSTFTFTLPVEADESD